MKFLSAILVFLMFGVGASAAEFLLPKEGREIELKWPAVENAEFYIVELSPDKEFRDEDTIHFDSAENYSWLKLKTEGTYYWRVRVGNYPKGKFLVGATELKIRKPTRIAAPKIEWLGRWTSEPELPKKLKWKKLWPAKEYVLEVYDPKKSKMLFEIRTKEPEYTFEEFEEMDPGYYVMRLAGIDKMGWVGRYAPCKWTYVGQKREIGAPPTSLRRNQICATRIPASTGTLSATFDGVRAVYNQSYSKSQFQWEGASFAMKSIIQRDSGEDFALAMISTVRGLHWFNNRWGVEGSYKSILVGYNELGSNISPQQIEGRVHWRFRTRFPWISLLKETQMSVFAGYEVYSNTTQNGALFAGDYSLYKAGSTLSFRVFDNWDTGGEFVGGFHPDGSFKIEMQGYLSYYLRRNWSIGMGYRVHLFSAGTVEISPDGVLPFKEAFGEAFGSLRYSF